MIPFLQSIAEGYAARYADLSEFMFVFPGRRSASFFLRHLQRTCKDRPRIAPATTTIVDLAFDISGYLPDSRIDLIFLLYNSYKEVWTRAGRKPEDLKSIDNFRSIADVLLADFNDIDTHLADAEQLFKNVTDHNEIRADYLTEEQRRVIEEYFGRSSAENIPVGGDRLWRTDYRNRFSDRENASDYVGARTKFSSFWDSLFDIYTLFGEKLRHDGLAYQGMAFREAVRKLNSDARIDARKVVFVGFNVLTACEVAIFKNLKSRDAVIDGRREPFADFVWDRPKVAETDPFSSADRYVSRGIRLFPKPEWLDLSRSTPAPDSDGLPAEIEVIAAPSNAMQAKICGAELGKIVNKIKESNKNTDKKFIPEKIAIVLPDEVLLLPLIHSLPDGLGDINLTMGCSLAYTPAVSFVNLLRQLQMHARTDSNGLPQFMHKDIDALLSHPFSMLLFGVWAQQQFKKKLAGTRRMFLYRENVELDEKSPKEYVRNANAMLRRVLTPLGKEAGTDAVVDYVSFLLETVREHNFSNIRQLNLAVEGKGGTVTETPDAFSDALMKANIEAYLQMLRRLQTACKQRGVDLQTGTVFILADRLIAGETVPFEGEPLRGIQIMGTLETRSLDFEHLIIPSMNEQIFPRKMHRRSFIPYTIRMAFNLPTTASEESIFAYYFYRMISRARSLTMIYDARSGDPSRYIVQLERLYRKKSLTSFAGYTLTQPKPVVISVDKSPTVMKALGRFQAPQGKHLSSSSLQKYLKCPLWFYYEKVRDIIIADEPQEFITNAQMGSIVHSAMQHLYLDADPTLGPALDKESLGRRKITRGFLDRLLKDDDRIISVKLKQAINEEFTKEKPDTPLSGEAKLQHGMLLPYIKKIVENDLKLAPFDVLGCELKIDLSIPVNGKPVNFVGFIDRLDEITDENGERQVRIVDYKTGNPSKKLSGDYVNNVFDPKASYAFQLMLYSFLLRNYPALRAVDSFTTVIYDVYGGKMLYPKMIVKDTQDKNKGNKTDIKSDTEAVLTVSDGSTQEVVFHEEFRRQLEAKIAEIFNPDLPFAQTDEPENCEYCPFRSLCRR